MLEPEPDPIPALKGQLARELVVALARWPQYAAAHFLGTDQPRISNLRNGKLGRFSLEQLVRFLTRFGADVSIEITWTARHTILRIGTPTNRPVGRGASHRPPRDPGRSVR